MRHIILLDNKIQDSDFEQWRIADASFWKNHIGINPTYDLVRFDYSDYPTFIDGDGHQRPTDAYLQSIADQMTSRKGKLAFDFIMVMIHKKNWKSFKKGYNGKGIWGTNFSYVFGDHCIDYCMWDHESMVNVFGVAYHERHHSFDAIIKVETGVDIRPILKVRSYDSGITHGGEYPWKYIRHRENTKSLEIMKPHLLKAFSLRAQKRKEMVETQLTLIQAIKELIRLLRRKLYQKYGMPVKKS